MTDVTVKLLSVRPPLVVSGFFVLRYEFQWGLDAEYRAYQIELRAEDELDAVVEFQHWAKRNGYGVKHDGD